jgi:hypothetical protein
MTEAGWPPGLASLFSFANRRPRVSVWAEAYAGTGIAALIDQLAALDDVATLRN